jgi:hypothetical protein
VACTSCDSRAGELRRADRSRRRIRRLAPDQCSAIIAGASDGERHFLASPVANRLQCPASYLVDLFYKLNVTAGLYLSWAATEPPSAETCKAAALEMRVWDMTAQPPALLGATKQAGAWAPNADPVGNPGMASICQLSPIR